MSLLGLGMKFEDNFYGGMYETVPLRLCSCLTFDACLDTPKSQYLYSLPLMSMFEGLMSSWMILALHRSRYPFPNWKNRSKASLYLRGLPRFLSFHSERLPPSQYSWKM
jgi:hypothetical protein